MKKLSKCFGDATASYETARHPRRRHVGRCANGAEEIDQLSGKAAGERACQIRLPALLPSLRSVSFSQISLSLSLSTFPERRSLLHERLCVSSHLEAIKIVLLRNMDSIGLLWGRLN